MHGFPYIPFPSHIFNPEQKLSFHDCLTTLKPLYIFIQGIHTRNTNAGWESRGHSLDHDLTVASFAHAIGRCYNPELARLATAAALMHSYDRYRKSGDSQDAFSANDILSWINAHVSDLNPMQKLLVYEAVVGHSSPNRGKKVCLPQVIDVLQDADKLATLMLYSVVRAGQYLPNVPTLEIGNLKGQTPGANYKENNVAYDALFGVMEWVNDPTWFVTKEARAILMSLEPPLRWFFDTVESQIVAIGLDTLPFID